jgi:hypothetical protein
VQAELATGAARPRTQRAREPGLETCSPVAKGRSLNPSPLSVPTWSVLFAETPPQAAHQAANSGYSLMRGPARDAQIARALPESASIAVSSCCKNSISTRLRRAA